MNGHNSFFIVEVGWNYLPQDPEEQWKERYKSREKIILIRLLKFKLI